MRPGAFRRVASGLLREGYGVRFRAYGTSMAPTIADGETLIARPLRPADARVGDVVLCDLGPRLVAHRLVRTHQVKARGQSTYVLHVRGDAPGAGTDRVDGESLLGRVESVERGGDCHAVTREVPRRAWVSRVIRRLALAISMLGVLLFASLQARADPSDIQVVTSSSSTATAVTSQSFSIDPGTGTNRLLLIAVSYASASSAITNITFAGQAASQDVLSPSGGGQFIEVWEVDNPPSGSGTIVITYSQVVSAVAGAVAFSNAATDPNTDSSKRNGTVATASTTGAARDVIFTAVSVTSAVGATAGGDQFTEWNTAVGPVLGAASVQTGATTASTWTWTPASSRSFAVATVDVTPSTTPTAILARSLVASDGGDGTFIRWRASTLGNTLGYRVYRQEPGRSGRRGVLLTPEMIGGAALSGPEGGSVMGARDYAWHDREAHAGPARYSVEEIDLSGQRRWSGPVTSGSGPAGGADTADSLTLSQQARAAAPIAAPASSSMASPTSAAAAPTGSQLPSFRPAATTSPAPDGACAGLASRAAVKIRVEREGMVQVTWADLVGAGLDDRTDRQRLRLYAGGREQPLRIVPAAPGGAESIEFYGIGRDTLWSASRTYWLTADGYGTDATAVATAPRETPIGPAAAGTGPSTSFPFTIERRDHTVYVAALKTADGDNFFGAVVNTAGVSESLTVTGQDSGDTSLATLEVVLQGATTAAHEVTVLLGGQVAGTIQFSGQTVGTGTFRIPAGQLLEGANNLTLRASSDDTDISLLVSTRLTYRHTYFADDDALFFPSPPAGVIRIHGFTTDQVRLFDVTDPDDAQEIPSRAVPEANGFAVVATRVLPYGRQLYAFAESQVLAPTSVRPNHPSSWHRSGAGAELVIVTHGPMLARIEPLAALRRAQGWSVATVEQQDVLDEYNCGEKNPGALKAFLQQSYRSPGAPARYVLLVGDASFDPHDYLGLGEHDHVPTKLLDTSTIQTASDDWFGDFDDDGVPELGVGRIPAATTADADAVVRKLLSYPTRFGESSGASTAWTSSGLFVADDNDGYDFESEVRRAEATLPSGMQTQEFFRSAQDPATAESALVGEINAGAALVDYAGHGSVQLWDGTFQTTDVPGLTNGSRLPVFVNMTCLNALFQDPRLESLGTSLLLADNGGAIAVWGAATSPDATDEDTANEAFVRGLSQGALGDAVIQAKAAVTDPDIRIAETLLGDPSLFGVPTRPTGPRGRPAEHVDVESTTEKAGGAASSCSIEVRPGGRTGVALGLLACASALLSRRRLRAGG